MPPDRQLSECYLSIIDNGSTKDRHMNSQGWNPDAVAPPLGDVYQREARAGTVSGYVAAACLGVSLALALVTWEVISRTGMFFGMAL